MIKAKKLRVCVLNLFVTCIKLFNYTRLLKKYFLDYNYIISTNRYVLVSLIVPEGIVDNTMLYQKHLGQSQGFAHTSGDTIWDIYCTPPYA